MKNEYIVSQYYYTLQTTFVKSFFFDLIKYKNSLFKTFKLEIIYNNNLVENINLFNIRK